jgi:excinuclease UvrABC nuclease subunit
MPGLPLRSIWFIKPFNHPTPLRLTFQPVFSSGPHPLSTTYVPRSGGLYAVMVYDATCAPLPYRLIYVGKAGKLSERVCASHEKYSSWKRAACGSPLYVAFRLIADESARTIAERQIIEKYRPECNTALNPNTYTLRSLLDLYTNPRYRSLSDLG